MKRVALLSALALFASIAAVAAAAADGTREIHGSADAFATPGVALAWAVLRAPKEEEVAVVIRIDADPSAYAWIEVVGKDPFSPREDRLQTVSAVGGPFDLKVPRARFADFPRTEIRLWRAGPAPNGPAPALVVYYQGVPDTTPEVAQARDLDASLSARMARARGESAQRSP